MQTSLCEYCVIISYVYILTAIPSHITTGGIQITDTLGTGGIIAAGQRMSETTGGEKVIGGRRTVTSIKTTHGIIPQTSLPRRTIQTLRIPSKDTTKRVCSADTLLTNGIHTTGFFERDATGPTRTIKRGAALSKINTRFGPLGIATGLVIKTNG